MTIKIDEVVMELIGLLTKLELVCIYVEHIDDEKAEGGEGNEEEGRNKDYADNESTHGLWSGG